MLLANQVQICFCVKLLSWSCTYFSLFFDSANVYFFLNKASLCSPTSPLFLLCAILHLLYVCSCYSNHSFSSLSLCLGLLLASISILAHPSVCPLLLLLFSLRDSLRDISSIIWPADNVHKCVKCIFKNILKNRYYLY